MHFSGYERPARIEESGEALPSEGAPEMVADIPDYNSKVLPMVDKLQTMQSLKSSRQPAMQ